MRIKITTQVDTERDREGETAADEERLADLAHEHLKRCMASLIDAAKSEGMSVEIHQG